MTTIATDGKSMAADSLITAGSEHVGNMRKVARTKDGRIYGCCGPCADAILFGQWIQGELPEKPALSEEFAALVLNPDGKVFYYHSKLVPLEYLVPMTIGSGGDFALGAMLAGKSPAEAVGIAAIRDTGTGGEIAVETLS